MENNGILTGVLLAVLFGSPWIVATAYYWRKLPRDVAVSPSLGEQLRKRLLS
jgi:hypothetical protein